MSTHVLPEYGFAANKRIKAQVRAILANETAPPRVYMRAFAPKGARLTVQGLDARDCKVRLWAQTRACKRAAAPFHWRGLRELAP